MSRWGRGRGGSVAVPLDSALFRENSNCPTAARSAGTVGKWGITSFTSIRSAPYAYSNNVPKKPVQDQNSPLTVPVETEAPPPKPKKFFKSRNAEAYPPVPQITYAPPVPPAPLSPEHSSAREKKSKRAKAVYSRDSSSPEPPRHKGSEKTKSRKNSVATKAAKKEDPTADETKPPNKRYLVRNRDKVINYAEDGSNSPIPDLTRYESMQSRIAQSSSSYSPKASPSVSSPTYVKPSLVSPTSSKDGGDDRKPPPIVLRISKGTSRIVSTDSNEGFTSPSSDRHSSMDMHPEAPDPKASPSMESICSPKHEGLKITIKCSGLTQESKKEHKKKEKKEGHKSHKRHHRNTDEESKKGFSPVPGSDTYDLYKTLASPVHESDSSKPVDDIESQLAQLDSSEPVIKSPRLQPQSTEPLPEPKPPESTSGRARRNRPNVNYSENDDYLDAVTSKRAVPKTVGELKRESRKNRKKNDVPVDTVNEEAQDMAAEPESQIEKSDLISILSGASETESESQKSKGHKKLKNKHSKQSSPSCVPEETPTDIEQDNEPAIQPQDPTEDSEPMDEPPGAPMDIDTSPKSPEIPSTNDHVEEDAPVQEDVFKPPQGVSDSEDKPSVKLVITKKKGSIFKSKSLVSNSDSGASPLPARKRRHLYKHEWDKGNETPRREPDQPENLAAANPTNSVNEELTRVTRYDPDPIIDNINSVEAVKPYTSVRCPKESKEYYTVVRNVKKAHQMQEIGEYQEFNDDVEYLLDAVQDNNPISTRCLSAITLAIKCTAPAFRMHLRAHGTVQKFFAALHDATNDQSLGLCTATVMFVLSQDRLNMDLDRESLELMLNLLESDASHKNALDDCGMTSAQLSKTQERVRELCAEIKNQGKAKHLDLDNITVGHLAMETLLSLTSKRAGEWFKEELRILGGVEHIVRTIKDCVRRLDDPNTRWTDGDIELLRKADRCMRVLENVTQQNEENQLYLVSGERNVTSALAALLRLCVRQAREPVSPAAAAAALDAALPAVKVLVNLSHAFGNNVSLGAEVIGEHLSVMEDCLIILNNQGNFINEEKNFEFSVCVLLLLINVVQNNAVNTEKLAALRVRTDGDEDVLAHRVPALELVERIFYRREDLAKQAEENTDALLEGAPQPDDKRKQSPDDIDETVAKLLCGAGTHMEHTMVGAYAALLLGHAARGAQHAGPTARAAPHYPRLLPTLTKYYNFLHLTASAEASVVAHVKATHRIIQFMQEQAASADLPQDMSISSLANSSSDTSQYH